MQPPPSALSRAVVRRSFERAATGYEAGAWLAQRVRAELLDRLQFFALEPRWILDLGAGTGQSALLLQQRYPHARVLALDLAAAMLRAAPQRRWPWQQRPVPVCADARSLPLASHSIDLIYSNLMLHWCDPADALLAELARVLRPGGLMMFSTFGPDTLRELRAAWAAADARPHVHRFPDLPELGDALARAGFAEPVLDVEHYQRHYADARALMQELRQLGSRNAISTRGRGLTGRACLATMNAAYEQLRSAQGLPATFEVIAGAAFGGGAPSGTAAGPAVAAGETVVPLASIRRDRRR